MIRFLRKCGARMENLVCQLPKGHAGQHQCGSVLWGRS